ncbi:MAG: UDP-2,3-diacylglucosamine diphosphatase [Bacteroidetes bacterium]|nr:UDP-2,3-diacylglucosamine diphosphatase [Bacteroidota bacterium]
MPSKIYFASDFHLGMDGELNSAERERIIVSWLNEIEKDASEIYLLGDMFDFWFEYKKAVPRGFIRLLGKLAQLSDKGIKLHFFPGNHDMWIFDYLPAELKLEMHREPVIKEIQGKKFYIAHGDGLGPGDTGYKIIKKIFANPLCRFLFRWIHPDIGIRLAEYLSLQGRIRPEEIIFMGEEKERLVVHAKNILKLQHIDYFIFGHRHIPVKLTIGNGSTFFYLGDWISNFTYAVFDGNTVEQRKYYP